jgi:ABC-2 type transport system permease protein
MRHLHLYRSLVAARVSKDLVYQANFWVAFITDLAIMALQTVVFLAIYQYTDEVAGWGRPEVLIFMATFIIINGLTMGTFFFGILSLPWLVRTGQLDIDITKPINTRFLVSLRHFDLGGLLGAVPGVALLVATVASSGIVVTWDRILGYVLLVMLMTVLYYSLMTLFRLPAFWLVKADALTDMEGELTGFAWRVPGVAFQGVERLLLLVLLPFGLIATVPAQAISGLLDPVQLVVVLGVTAAQVFCSSLLWRMSLLHYSSASS